MTARPIITMDEADETLWLIDPDQPAKPTHLGYIEGQTFWQAPRLGLAFVEVKAIADFLCQLEGANLLSAVGDEEDE